jgi:hypothetical protein
MTKPDVRTVLHRLAGDVRNHYGDRLRGIYRIDTRGLSNANEQADVEVAVVLTDGDWRPVDEMKTLVYLKYDLLVETELYIRALPLPFSAWQDPSKSREPASIREMKDRAEPLMEAVC